MHKCVCNCEALASSNCCYPVSDWCVTVYWFACVRVCVHACVRAWTQNELFEQTFETSRTTNAGSEKGIGQSAPFIQNSV